MKISALLSLFLALAFLNPAETVLCAYLKSNFQGSADSFKCRNRPAASLLGGPGCQITCRSTNSTCGQIDGEEVCGKLRLRVGFYVLGKVKYEFCLIPEGLLQRRFGRYCFSVRYCLLQRQACGCSAVQDGRPCRCRIKEDVNGNPVPETNCAFTGPDSSSSVSAATALLPSENDIESGISMQFTDPEVADQVDDAYSLFLDYMESLQ